MLSDILTSLYSNDENKIYSILNKSKYITDIKNYEKAILFNTGFQFETHKGKSIDIYFDLNSNSIIRSPVSTNLVYGKIPQLIGLLCPISSTGYIEKYYTYLITKIFIDEENSTDECSSTGLQGLSIENPENLKVVNKAINVVDEDNLKSVHTSFQLVDKNNSIRELPLCKSFSQIVYYNTARFEEYSPNKYNSERSQSEEEWYRSEFGDDAESAWWNTH